MEDKDISGFVTGITVNLDGLLQSLDKVMSDATKNITPDQAKEMRKAWNDYKLDDKLAEIKRETFAIKNDFDIK